MWQRKKHGNMCVNWRGGVYMAGKYGKSIRGGRVLGEEGGGKGKLKRLVEGVD